MAETVYKIRDRETGLFSSGGHNPRWEKDGKIWRTMANLKSHLTRLSPNFRHHDPGFHANAEIVECVISAVPLDLDVCAMISEAWERKRKRDENDKAKQAEYRRLRWELDRRYR